MAKRDVIPVDAEDLLTVVYALNQLSLGLEMTPEQKTKLFLLETRLERSLGFLNA